MEYGKGQGLKKGQQPLLLVVAICLLGASLIQDTQAQDFSTVPGEVLDYVALQYDIFYTTPRRFVADPEIAVLPNGDYVAAWAMSGRSSTADTAGVTTLYRSSDKGATWTSLGTQTPFLRGSLFVHDGALYFLGGNFEGGAGVIKKSLDNGSTWSTTTLSISASATPNNPAVFNNRIWSAVSTSSHFVSDTSDLMQATSWSQGAGYGSQPSWPSEGEFMGEGQMVASPEQGVVLLPKVKQHALTAISRVNSTTGAVTVDPDNDFVALPGGEKKFGAGYDAVSGKFYIISNPVLPAHSGSSILPDMIRNTSALLSSSDLRSWKVEKFFLYFEDIDREGAGYMNFDIDGTNMAVIARTAFKVPGETYPTRGHDSNVLTFHTIPDFRNATPDQVLRLENGDVVRYEKTQYQDAPLGTFSLGSSFAGAPLTNPSGFGQDANGDIYIQESGGRILRFDATGNFIATTNTSPIALQSSELSVVQSPNGTSSWVASGSGEWFESINWHYWNRGDTDEEIATFGSAIESASTITVNTPQTVKGLRFIDDDSCTFSGTGALTLAANTGNSIIDVQQGAHALQIPVTLNSSTDFQVTAGASLQITGNIDLNGNTLNVSGPGLIEISDGEFLMNESTLSIASETTVTLTNALAMLNGTIEFKAPSGFSPVSGNSYHVIDGDMGSQQFSQIILPTLDEGLGWDTSTVYSNGNITVILKVPTSWMATYNLPEDGSAEFIDTGTGNKSRSYYRVLVE